MFNGVYTVSEAVADYLVAYCDLQDTRPYLYTVCAVHGFLGVVLTGMTYWDRCFFTVAPSDSVCVMVGTSLYNVC